MSPSRLCRDPTLTGGAPSSSIIEAMAKLRLEGRNLDLHYELRGGGSPLLLLMGWRGNLDWWPEALLGALETRHRLVLLDNRGAGRTGDPGGDYSIRPMADDPAGLPHALAIPPADGFGASMGGRSPHEMALAHPPGPR